MRAADCHPDRKHYAKGLCSKCYGSKVRKRWKPTKPANCHPDRLMHARGLCGPCYQRLMASGNAPKIKRAENYACGHKDLKHEARGMCKACYTAWYRKQKGSEDVRARRDYRLKKDYGVSADDVDALFYLQAKRCKLCRKEIESAVKAHVDHCHETGRIRGLLCFTCNKALGMLGDNEDGLLLALGYVKSSFDYAKFIERKNQRNGAIENGVR